MYYVEEMPSSFDQGEAENLIPSLTCWRDLENHVTNPVLNRYLLSCKFEDYRIVFFKDGRAIIHSTNEAKKARAVYNRFIQFY